MCYIIQQSGLQRRITKYGFWLLLITFKFAWWFEWYVPQDNWIMDGKHWICCLENPKVWDHDHSLRCVKCRILQTYSLERDLSTFSSRQRAFAGIINNSHKVVFSGVIIIRNKCRKCFFLLLLCTFAGFKSNSFACKNYS